jgi:two-component system sensor histidine kinase KdpD
LGYLAAANLVIVALCMLELRWLGVRNPTTVPLSFLLVILLVATRASLWVPIVTALNATALFNYFFLPPTRTFTVADPHNWIALAVFLIVGIVASNLSSSARARASEAVARRDEVTRLFDLSRDILLITDSAAAVPSLATHIARRFELDTLTLYLPGAGGWQRYDGGHRPSSLEPALLDEIFTRAGATIEFDARRRIYGGHREVDAPDGVKEQVVPLRIGTAPIGLMAAAGDVDAATLDAVAGVGAIAVERAQFLEERKAADLERQRADLASALLASFSHDLRTPLTAIQVAVSNLVDPANSEEVRREQAEVAMAELQRLSRLLQIILDMARIDAGISPEREWVSPAEVVDAATAIVSASLKDWRLEVDADTEHEVEIDPRLTAGALAHILENATQYSPPGSLVRVHAWVSDEGFQASVLDQGPGLDPADLDHLFDRFYRGARPAANVPGLGLGLSITRGLIAAQGGRVWGENAPPDGARFTLLVPARSRSVSLQPIHREESR